MKKASFVLFAGIISVVFCFLIIGCAGGGSGDNAASNNSGQSGTTADPPIPTPVPSIDVSINQLGSECLPSGDTKLTAYLSVIDENGVEINSLDLSAITVSENADVVDPANIGLSFVEQQRTPLTVSVIMDYSTSVTDVYQHDMENAVKGFLDFINPTDEAEIIKFANDVQVMQTFTNNVTLLKAAVDAVPNVGVWTYLYDGLYVGVEDAATGTARKAVVAITDGVDHRKPGEVGLNKNIDDVITLAIQNHVPVFIIGVGLNIDSAALGQLADQTGGHFYQAYNSSQLQTLYQQISQLLNIHQYVMTLEVSPTGNPPGSDTLTVDARYNGLTGSDTKAFNFACP